jgi:hypothetical protein
MTPEVLEKIATIISSLGADAKEGLIWYMGFWFACNIISIVFISATVVVCFKVVSNLIKYIVNHCCASSQLAIAAGAVLHNGEWHPKDVANACEILRQHPIKGK